MSASSPVGGPHGGHGNKEAVLKCRASSNSRWGKKKCDCLAHILVLTNVRKESFYKRKMLSGWGLTNVFGKFNSDGVFRPFVQSNRLQVIFRWKPAMWSLKPTPDCMTVWRTTDKSWAGLSFHRQVADDAAGHSWPVCDFCRLFIVWK